MSQLFSFPSAPGQRLSTRAQLIQKSSKRKRDDSSEGEAADDADTHEARSASSHSDDDLSDATVLGMSGGVPPPPFPHKPERPSTIHRQVRSETLKHMADLNPPIYPRQTERASTLRQQHLSVMVALLHRCLAEGDFTRAGQAWGLLLRSEIQSRPFDLRREGRWGIGAEILLRTRSLAPSTSATMNIRSDGQNDAVENSLKSMFNQDGFRLAREYFERLIRHHPYLRTSPHSINETHLYPAMFSLWIFEATENSKRLRHGLQMRQESHDRSLDCVDEARIKDVELAQAREIAERLDRIISGPPYDKQTHLLELCRMVHLWVADLIAPPTRLNANDNKSIATLHGHHVDGSEVSSNSADITRVRPANNETAQLEEAKALFDKARDLGGLKQSTERVDGV